MVQPKDSATEFADVTDCSRCELAVYCYTEPSTWIFRTKSEMAEKRERMERCPVKVGQENRKASAGGLPSA
ncbi:hypothetical protein SAMN02745206_02044 [Desulfacinum infernum DSM 9756]|uniref:Uncharacterized protein n=1 Tax=Desulfacinum infernum DSM 9756 TaxID=1121391 RepID=A0A1M5BW48_9BACT|nr:hypothetical protein [Desulfacinum infernum]SHF46739.1 hypothetical protein SAMN02745206_02044 [Desulfacinum infernum DSM 9756]